MPQFRKRKQEPADEEEQQLAESLFAAPKPIEQYSFFIDGASKEDAWSDNQDIQVDVQSKNRLKKLRNDYNETVISANDFESRLRSQFQKINPTPEWATQSEEQEFNTTTPLVSKLLNPSQLEIMRVKDANHEQYSNCVIQTVKFHPNAPILLTAGFDKVVRIFQIDGKYNPKISSIKLQDLPVYSADFSADGKQILMTGRKSFFYFHDLSLDKVQKVNKIVGRMEKSLEKMVLSPCGRFMVVLGRDGYIILVSLLTKQWAGNLKINGYVSCVAFHSDQLFALGDDCVIHQFDLNTMECVKTIQDDGMIKPTSIAVSPDGRFIATGSNTGVVHLYKDYKLVKAIMNIVTSISTILFHPSNQIMLLASKYAKDSLKVVHLGTSQVFKNWPTSATPLGYVSDCSFSSNGRFLAIGNAKGKVLLYRFGQF